MIKEKLKQFKVEIRRQQKDKIFAEKRKEQYQINQVGIIVKQIYDIELAKQNFPVLKECFHKINEILIEYSKLGSKGVLLDLQKVWNQKGQIPYNPLEKQKKKFTHLTSNKFKCLTLSLIEQSTLQSKSKLRNQYEQVSQEILFQIFLMIALLFKEPVSLLILFPFKSIDIFESTSDSEEEQNQGDDQENTFQLSFELFETNLFYLKAKFDSIKQQSRDMMVFFLSILHSITTVMKFFVTNNTKKSKGIEMGYKKCQDQQKVTYLYNLLKSHNFENYIESILREIIQYEEQDENQKGFSLSHQVSVFISLISLANMYLELVEFVKVQTISYCFVATVKNFSKFTLDHLCYHKEVTFKQQTHQSIPIIKNNAINIYLRVLFQLHSLTNHSLLSLTGKQALPICIELIEFLMIKTNLQLFTNNSYQQVSYDNQRKNLDEFFFSVLVAEEDDKWMHFLEILPCLEQIVRNYDFTLEEILHYAIQQELEFNERVVRLLFENLAESISSISGYFYNQRHIFLTSLVNLFVLWIQNSFPSQNLMSELLFWYDIAEILQKAISQIEQSVKDSESIEFSLRRNELTQTESSSQSKLNCEMLTTLDELRNLIDHVLKEANENDFEKKMEIYE